MIRPTTISTFPKRRGLSPEKGPVRDGSDAVKTPGTERSCRLVRRIPDRHAHDPGRMPTRWILLSLHQPPRLLRATEA